MFMLFGTSATNMSWRTPQMSLTGAPLSDYNHTPFDDGMVAGPLDEQFELMDGEAAKPCTKSAFLLFTKTKEHRTRPRTADVSAARLAKCDPRWFRIP